MDEEALLEMKYTSWCCGVRHVLSQLLALGKAHVPRQSPTTKPDAPAFSLIRCSECPLLWQIKGGANDVFIHTKTEKNVMTQQDVATDVVLFPQRFARFEDSVSALHSLQGVSFVHLDLGKCIQTHPTSTLLELNEIERAADQLKALRDSLIEKAKAGNYSAFLAHIKTDVSSKCHKLALIYVHAQLRNVGSKRTGKRKIVILRRTAFTRWMNTKFPEADKVERPTKVVRTSPPLRTTTTVLTSHGTSFFDAIMEKNPNAAPARATEFALAVQAELKKEVLVRSASQLRSCMVKLVDDLKTKEEMELNVLLGPNMIGTYIRRFFPAHPTLRPAQTMDLTPRPAQTTDVTSRPLRPALLPENRPPRPSRKYVTFPPSLQHIKFFDVDDTPESVRAAPVHQRRSPETTTRAVHRGGPTPTSKAYEPFTRKMQRVSND
ncbi:hypothetical protein SDRG_03499 [Saprolegnia diclina VS20]|uniref:Uncharacterized protein n=1 Tax=Saprolegnia diclina (strain VS20) TaxID=1156394 RepID=T0S2R0_SAPDV|nr:hypothetical protein SDRG_03499 [Saprolegnia diclina VS20]EQC39293.1 hypothetical protein SDRG_03499 [Saprolegnia diclina VS20]|eukprot:XP_008607354.1 hypothetical protein SDRG_03499 [Saprolegnia diclina VS20]